MPVHREEETSAPDPFARFRAWFERAREAGVTLPEAATLATASADGAPSARVVLVKEVDRGGGFRFFTNYESRKGRELAENPRAALVFDWHALGRQVRVEGEVGRLAREDSETYFRTRPRGSRIGAWASRQSEPIPDRAVLERRAEELGRAYPGDDVPLPPFWGGYRLAPHTVEFWEHRGDRLHDRFRYRRVGGCWVGERLSP